MTTKRKKKPADTTVSIPAVEPSAHAERMLMHIRSHDIAAAQVEPFLADALRNPSICDGVPCVPAVIRNYFIACYLQGAIDAKESGVSEPIATGPAAAAPPETKIPDRGL